MQEEAKRQALLQLDRTDDDESSFTRAPGADPAPPAASKPRAEDAKQDVKQDVKLSAAAKMEVPPTEGAAEGVAAEVDAMEVDVAPSATADEAPTKQLAESAEVAPKVEKAEEEDDEEKPSVKEEVRGQAGAKEAVDQAAGEEAGGGQDGRRPGRVRKLSRVAREAAETEEELVATAATEDAVKQQPATASKAAQGKEAADSPAPAQDGASSCAASASTSAPAAPAPAAPAAPAFSAGSNSAWAAMLIKKKQEDDEKGAQETAEKAKAKADPKAEALARTPIGHLEVRGILVPHKFEGHLDAWRYIFTAPLRGWALQHSGPERMRSLWVRTDNCWYWLRVDPKSFAVAKIGRRLWAPPGSSASAPMSEQLLMASPLATTYTSTSISPPPRGLGVSLLGDAAGAPFTAADAADADGSAGALRLSAFLFTDVDGKTVDLFSALPQGVSTSSAAVHLLGQALPIEKKKPANNDGDEKSDAWPARMWLRSLPVHEWRLHVDTTAAGGSAPGSKSGSAGVGSASGAAKPKVWVRSAASWFLLLKPRADVTWSPPGSHDRPLPDALLPAGLSSDDRPPLENKADLPCRRLLCFSVHAANGTLTPILRLLGQLTTSNPGAEKAYACGCIGTAGRMNAANLEEEKRGVGGTGNGGIWVNTGPILAGQVDYTTQPPCVWIRTATGLYSLTTASNEYAHLYKLPGSSRAHPIDEASLSGSLLSVFRRDEDHPFTSKKGLVIPALHLSEFELVDANGNPRPVLKTLPEGTLRAAEKLEKARLTASGKEVPPKNEADETGASQFEALNVYVRARLMPVGCSANARPWVRAGPVRAWSIDFEKKTPDGKSVAGLWLCSKSAALYMAANNVSTASDAHSKGWCTGDGLLVHYASEVLAGCREHRDPRNAVKLFNMLISSAWARMPTDISSKYGLRKEVLYEKHVADFVLEVLQDAGYKLFATRLEEERKKAPRLPNAAKPTTAALPPKAPPKPVAAIEVSEVVGNGGKAAKASAASSGAAGAKRPASATMTGSDGADGAAPSAKVATVPAATKAGNAASSSGGRQAAAKPAPSAAPATVPPKDLDDADIARAMLAVLRKAHAPLSYSQVALSCKDDNPTIVMNFARWLQAVQRGLKARPQWFVHIGAEMLSIGPEAGVEPTEPAEPAVPPAASPTPVAAVAPAALPAAAFGGVATGGPGVVSGGPGVATGGPGVVSGGPGVTSGGPGMRRPTGGP